MTTPAPLNTYISQLAKHMSWLQKQLNKPEVQLPAIKAQAFDFSLESLCQLLKQLHIDQENHELQQLKAAIDEFQTKTKPLSAHLIAITENWRCEECRSNVAAGIKINGVQSDSLDIFVRCKACKDESPIDTKGKRVFFREFGHLVGPDWNPRLNGFTWTGR